MAIVKIYPEDANKSDFSIRLVREKYHVFEGDTPLFTHLDTLTEADDLISSVVKERIAKKVVSVKVTHVGLDPEEKAITPYKRKHTLTKKNCAICNEDFNSIRTNHIYCSRKCSNEGYVLANSKELKVEQSFDSISEALPQVNKSDLREFDDLTRKSYSDRKRINYFKDFIDLLIEARNYSVEMERKWDFDTFYKNLMRNNLVFYNNVNIFSLMPSLFIQNEERFEPVEIVFWDNLANQKSALDKILSKMQEMSTYATHQQQGALSIFSSMTILSNDILALNDKVEVLLEKIQSLSKIIKSMDAEKPKNGVEAKKKWFNF